MYEYLSLSGGSNKGYSYIGIIKALSELKLLKDIKYISGSSIGSFFATLICMGFEVKDLYSFIQTELEFNDIDLDNFLLYYGFSSGVEIINNFKKVIKQKYDPEITFSQLFVKTGKVLYISSLCLNTTEIEYFSYKNYPTMKVIDAIRLSISLPYIFTSIKLNENNYVDAAIFEKLPLKIFPKNKKILGISLQTKNDIVLNKKPNNIDNLYDYTNNLIHLFKKMVHQKEVEDFKDYNIDLIEIVLDDLNPLDFNLTLEKKKLLIKDGYMSIRKYFKSLI